MLNRRSLLATLLCANGGSFATAAARDEGLPDVGLQLYTVRTLLERDFEGTLAKIAALGYRKVEFAGLYGPSIAETRAMLDRQGLAAPSGHVSYDKLDRDLPGALQTANLLGQKFIVCPSVDEGLRRTLDDWKRTCGRFNRIGAQAKVAGLGFAYHNHDVEFRPLDGQIPYDVLLGETDLGLVRLEIDLYWMAKAGRDPVDYFRKYPGRFPLLHLKDKAQDGSIVDLGQGTIDFQRILDHAGLAGMAYCFVEHDRPADPLRSIETSLRYLRQLTPGRNSY